MHPADAAARGIERRRRRPFNDRGACLAGAVLTEEIRPGVVLARAPGTTRSSPGSPGSLDKHGNPNVLTAEAAPRGSLRGRAPSAPWSR